MVGGCPICRKPSVPNSDFCILHFEAMKSIEDGYVKWCSAFGQEITRRDYFQRLLRLEETGTAAKKVIEYMQKQLGAP
ncbi:MAG TPA: hypothetical protein VEI80_04065 [Candidatus Acidoferrales bacterium]|nr:hypothetical protein [Candidatus Acidoferrales bacterium]